MFKFVKDVSRINGRTKCVNHKYFEALENYRAECELPKLINIGSCSLHIIHGAFQTGAEKSSWNLKKTLRGIWQILHDSPARREDYEAVTGSTTYPLSFCVITGHSVSRRPGVLEIARARCVRRAILFLPKNASYSTLVKY